jgi:transketolase
MSKPQRLIFGETLVELGRENPRIVVLDADVSSSTQTRLFAAKFPDRFFNFGIAEANMVSASAGLASCGYIPFVSTFALFLSLRAGDQVRAQIAQPRANVKLIGGYAGLSDFADGASHQSVEDLAVMRAIPNMTVISPCDIGQTQQTVRAIAEFDGPVFLRISRAEVDHLLPENAPFQIGKANVLREGRDVTLIACGAITAVAIQAADALTSRGISVTLIDMPTIKPLDNEAVFRAAKATGALVTVEEHTVCGGLGGAVCEAVCQSPCPAPVVRVGIPDCFGESGAYPQILHRCGLDVEHLVAAAKHAITLKG